METFNGDVRNKFCQSSELRNVVHCMRNIADRVAENEGDMKMFSSKLFFFCW